MWKGVGSATLGDGGRGERTELAEWKPKDLTNPER